MENASKALIIAGAILLSILLISLGIMVYNNAKDTASKGNLNDTEVQGFNSKFTPFIGTNISANQLNSLLSAVQASNLSEKNSGSGRYIGVEVTGTVTGATSSAKKTYGSLTEGTYAAITSLDTYIASKTYKAVATYSDKTGLIYKIVVTTN